MGRALCAPLGPAIRLNAHVGTSVQRDQQLCQTALLDTSVLWALQTILFVLREATARGGTYVRRFSVRQVHIRSV